jgi:hypothetical protein
MVSFVAIIAGGAFFRFALAEVAVFVHAWAFFVILAFIDEAGSIGLACFKLKVIVARSLLRARSTL